MTLLIFLYWLTVVIWILLLGVLIAIMVSVFDKIEKHKDIRISPIVQGLIIAFILWGGQNILTVILNSFKF